MRSLLVSALVLLAGAPAASAADATIYAAPPFTFVTPDVSIPQGGTVDFTNLDPIGHDVMATENGPDGKPWFRSEVISGGETSPVAGTEFLVGGAYPFICSIHPSMQGTLTVTGEGTPKPRPGGGEPPPPQSPPPPPSDTAAPLLSVAVLDSRVSAVRKRRAIRLRIGSDEPATARVTVRVGRRSIASGTFELDTSGKDVRVKLSAAGRKAVKKAKRLPIRVSVLASDAQGNRAAAGASRTLR